MPAGRGEIDRPATLPELRASVFKALKGNYRIRGVGAARGLSAATIPVGTRIVSTEKLKTIYGGLGRDIPGRKLKPDADKANLVRVQSGTPVPTVLAKLMSQDRMLRP